MSNPPPAFPLRAVLLLAALQFLYILDFVMVLPLAPDLAQALHFGVEYGGWLGAAYGLASALAGVLGMRYLDHVPRKPGLLCMLLLFAVCTLCCALAENFLQLLLWRAATGFCGGAMLALALACLLDLCAPEQRGRGFAIVMSGFPLAAIGGVPAMLEAARLSPQLPFLLLAAACGLLWLGILLLLPAPARQTAGGRAAGWALLRRPEVRQACVLQALAQASAFFLIPQMAVLLLNHAHLPRANLGMLYALGGIAALLTVNYLGRLCDREGPGRAILLASALFIVGLLPWLQAGRGWSLLLCALCFVAFMAGNAGRNIGLSTLCSALPAPPERAGFMALQSLVQDVAIAAASLASSWFFLQGQVGVQVAAGLSVAASLLLAGMVWQVRGRWLAQQ